LRRDTESWLNALAGGRIFPGVHHHRAFRVREDGNRFEVAVAEQHGEPAIDVCASVSERWSEESVFESLAEASAFFEFGSLGYSPARELGRFQGLELKCKSWRVQALDVETVRSSVFDD